MVMTNLASPKKKVAKKKYVAPKRGDNPAKEKRYYEIVYKRERHYRKFIT